jgi:hypothetical protein
MFPFYRRLTGELAESEQVRVDMYYGTAQCNIETASASSLLPNLIIFGWHENPRVIYHATSDVGRRNTVRVNT